MVKLRLLARLSLEQCLSGRGWWVTGQTPITTSSSMDEIRNYAHFEQKKPGSEILQVGGRVMSLTALA